MSHKQFLRAALKTSNTPKVNDALPLAETLNLNKLWPTKKLVEGKFKSLRDLR